MSKQPWMFAGYPTVWVDCTGLGLRDSANKAWAAATGGSWDGPVDNDESYSDAEVRMDPEKQYSFNREYTSIAERKAKDKYGIMWDAHYNS